MDKQTMESIREQLVAERRGIEEELGKLRNAASENVTGSEEGDEAAEVAQQSDNLSLGDELEKALRDIDGALKMIDAGTYGTCKYCKQPIDERRLIARPTSSSCIQCKKTLTQEV